MTDPTRSPGRILAAALALAACAPTPDPVHRFDEAAIARRTGPVDPSGDGVCAARHRGGWFEAPCAAALTPAFVVSLQRALAARDLHAGPVTGRYDAATRRAIRTYQRAEGLDSDVLAVATAKRLGLWVYSPADLKAG